MPTNVAAALVYIINALSSLVLLILLLRLVLPFLRADFRNPIAQGILKITSPLVIPMRRVLPSIGRLDTATFLLAYAIQFFAVWLTFMLLGGAVPAPILAFVSLTKLIVLTINLFVYAIIISIVISWIAPGRYSPIAAIVATISEPVLRPFRRIIPPVGGFDISPIFAIIALTALTYVIGGFQPF
ncbi:MAG: YggT family protein [Woeseiaceae bacterium]|nr:YggT family protein [Woeseiaceae bacterium]